tara:strand:+ start:412 stop:738 length:327 start_codon:yes stop_codon:yes gene_type:complete
MIEQDYNNIGVWEIELYRLDDDGNPLTDKKGNVIKYEYKHLETMIDTDYINADDLEEVSDGIDNLEQEILSALKINRDVNWIEHDANDEFDNLITFVKTLFSRYRGNN